MKGGRRVYGLARVVCAKDRAKGMGDAEVTLDKDWWMDEETTTDEMREALLDHELHHLRVKEDADGAVLRDDSGRPRIVLRKHDVEAGWFRVVAERNGEHSMEQRQAKQMFEAQGQYFWPDIAKIVPLKKAA